MLEDRLVRGRVTAGGEHYPVPGGMIETAENLRREYSIPRDEQDELALRSHQRAVAAQTSGTFDDEIVPVEVKERKTGTRLIDRDEHPRADASLESLGSLRPVMRAQGSRGHGHRRQRQRAERRRRGVHRHRRREGVRAGPHADGAAGQLGGRGRAAPHDGHRTGTGDGQGAWPRRAHAGRHRPHRAQRGVRRPGAGRAARLGAPRRTSSGSTSTAPGISLGHPIGATGGRILATLLRRAAAGAARATAWRPCASAAARDWPRSSRTWRPETVPGGDPGAPPHPDEATLREVVQALAPLERRAGSEGEHQAARWLAQRLREAGCNAQVEPERYHEGYARVMSTLSIASGLAGAAALASPRARRAAGAVAGAVLAAIADDVSNGPRLFRRAASPARTTWNVVGDMRGAGRAAHAGAARPPRRRPHRARSSMTRCSGGRASRCRGSSSASTRRSRCGGR